MTLKGMSKVRKSGTEGDDADGGGGHERDDLAVTVEPAVAVVGQGEQCIESEGEEEGEEERDEGRDLVGQDLLEEREGVERSRQGSHRWLSQSDSPNW